MTDTIELVKSYNDAFQSKDIDTARNLIHPAFTFKGPMMEMDSPDEYFALMSKCPVACSHQNVNFVASGDKVVTTFDWVVTSPVEANLRMCEVLTIKDNKILKSELFYDTAKFPQEIVDIMQAGLQDAA